MDLLPQLPDFGNLLWTAAAFVVALSIIVFVHEFGHYIVGRWSGIKADVFSIGFGPRLVSRVDRHGTRWQLAALPFGGYVKFRGDADAASAGQDSARLRAMTAEERRQTMQGAPLWARAATVAAGPVFNFIFTIVIFAGVIMTTGIASKEARVGAINPLPVETGLRAGDLVVAIGGMPVADLRALYATADAMDPVDTVEYVVERAGQTLRVQGPFPLPALAAGVQPDSAARDAGMRAGDVILSINGQPVHAFRELRQLVGEGNGEDLLLKVWRAGDAGGTVEEMLVKPRRMDLPAPDGGFETRWLIGLSGGMAFMPEKVAAGPVEAVGMAVQQLWNVVSTSLSGLWHMITGAISSCNLRGPLGIAESSGHAASMGTQNFIWFLGVLSAAIGMMNLFPIPVLDGGHLVFHAWEAVTGKPPSERALNRLMTVGFGLLLTMMVFALSNDLFCP